MAISLEKIRRKWFLGCSRKCSPLQERGMATNSRLCGEGAALHNNLEVGIHYQKCYHYSMPVRMRGGLAVYPEWKGERVFMTATGIKIRRVNGRYQYNPPTLKFACVRVLDRHFPDPRDGRLYTNVQHCLDQLVSLVETHLKGVEWEGMSNCDW